MQHNVHKRIIDGSIAGQHQNCPPIGHLAHAGANTFNGLTVVQPFLGIHRGWRHAGTQIARLGIDQLHFGTQGLTQCRLHIHASKAQSVGFSANAGSHQRCHHRNTRLRQDTLS